jgi:hypothetical protein
VNTGCAGIQRRAHLFGDVFRHLDHFRTPLTLRASAAMAFTLRHAAHIRYTTVLSVDFKQTGNGFQLSTRLADIPAFSASLDRAV